MIRMKRSYKKKIIIALIAAVVIILLGVGYRLITQKMSETGTADSAAEARYPSDEEKTEEVNASESGSEADLGADSESASESADSVSAENETEEPSPLFHPEEITWILSSDLDIDTFMSHPEVLTSVCKIVGGSDYLFYISEDMSAQKVTFTYNDDIAVVGYVHKDPMISSLCGMLTSLMNSFISES